MLVNLNLSDNDIDDTDILLLGTHDKLKRLTLIDTQVSERGAEALATKLPGTTIVYGTTSSRRLIRPESDSIRGKKGILGVPSLN